MKIAMTEQSGFFHFAISEFNHFPWQTFAVQGTFDSSLSTRTDFARVGVVIFFCFILKTERPKRFAQATMQASRSLQLPVVSKPQT